VKAKDQDLWPVECLDSNATASQAK
jgi:hypothetical protein